MNAEALAKVLGGRRSGRQFRCCCPAHEDTSPSLIVFDGHDAVQVRCLAGCEPIEVIGALRQRGLWDGRGDAVERSPPRPTSVGNAHELRMIARARLIWDSANPSLAGTLAQAYLEGRDLWGVAKELADVRFIMRCPREHGVQPALVVAMRDVESCAVLAIQRLFLRRDDAGRVVKDCSMMLGRAHAAAMQLVPLGTATELAVAEGFESAASVVAMDGGVVWGLGSTSGMRGFPVIEQVERLVIWADHDPADPRSGRHPGWEAALTCRDRYRLAGRAVETKMPDVCGHDANDVWRARCGRG